MYITTYNGIHMTNLLGEEVPKSDKTSDKGVEDDDTNRVTSASYLETTNQLAYRSLFPDVPTIQFVPYDTTQRRPFTLTPSYPSRTKE